MASNITTTLTTETSCPADTLQTNTLKVPKYQRHMIWRNVILHTYLHIASIYGIYLMFFQAKWITVLWTIFLYLISGLGVTAGAHRLWSHRSYKARLPLRIFLAFANLIAFQREIFVWARDHRVHHKYSETDADPYNAKRGFFFSHVGWLLCKKHPEVNEKGKTLDLSDLYDDSVVMFQRKYYWQMMPICCIIMPTIVPMYFWNESFNNSWHMAAVFRYTLGLNAIWLVNSVAHKWGNKPYDRHINPTENIGVALAAFGEGWHNYHHVFPWDYKASELGTYSTNFATCFIDFMSKLGLAYDLKTVPVDLIRKRCARTGDDSHSIWGWGDKDLLKEKMNDLIFTDDMTKSMN